MTMAGLSLVLGSLAFLYLSTFVVFALIRIATGISIQRLGYLSLRRIAYTPKEGIRVDIRRLGLHVHYPSFARPTWVSVRLSDIKVTVDIAILAQGKHQKGELVSLRPLEEQIEASSDTA